MTLRRPVDGASLWPGVKPWLAIRLVVEFAFRDHFMAPLTMKVPAACLKGFCGSGTGFTAQNIGRTGDLILGFRPGNLVSYQPADRFWTFQFIEAGIFVALTAAALGATIWLLHRRPAWAA